MRIRFIGSMISVAVAAAVVTAFVMLFVSRTHGQEGSPARIGGKPNFGELSFTVN